MFEVCDGFIFMKKRRYPRNVFVFKNFFNIDQYVFGVVRGSTNRTDNLVQVFFDLVVKTSMQRSDGDNLNNGDNSNATMNEFQIP